MNSLFKFCLLFLFCCHVFAVQAQDSHTSDTDRKWYIPDHAVVQFAGNIGLFSAGAGYSYLHDKMQSDILYGFVPSFETESHIHMLTVKTAYHPYKIDLENTYIVEPLRFGTGISYSYGPQFFTSLPKRYPDKYYWWASSLRITPFIGAAISKKIGNDATIIKRAQFYAEIGSTDLDIVSKIGNKNLSVYDIINFAVGTKLVF